LIKPLFKQLLQTVGLLKFGIAFKRFWYQLSIGFIDLIRKTIFRNLKAPQVKESLSELKLTLSSSQATQELSLHDPVLINLYERYKTNTPFVEITSPFWHEIPERLDLQTFRSHGGYLWTKESGFRYKVTAMHLSSFDRLKFLRLLGEDTAFGCQTFSFRGATISRDKLDSAMEIYYLMDVLGIRPFDQLKVLDIGAGYGRFAHRFASVFKKSHIYCVDAIPISTYLCDFYLAYRNILNSQTVPLDRLDSLKNLEFDFAISIHSFPEQTEKSIDFWLDLLDSLGITRLILVDHNGKWLTMEPPDNWRSCYFPLLTKHGWHLLDARPKYSTIFGKLFGIESEAVYSFFGRS